MRARERDSYSDLSRFWIPQVHVLKDPHKWRQHFCIHAAIPSILSVPLLFPGRTFQGMQVETGEHAGRSVSGERVLARSKKAFSTCVILGQLLSFFFISFLPCYSDLLPASYRGR